jgi:cysteine-S-conjugate beta-lyase
MDLSLPLARPTRHDTLLAHAGRNPAAFGGLVNIPACRGSTIVAATLEEWESRKTPDNAMASYGRFGTASTRAFEEAMTRLEGGHRAMVFPSGLSACTHTLLALLAPGDHVLLTDSVYGPTRQFACSVLARMGVQVEFFAPGLGAGIQGLLRPNTRCIYLESPGSLTFEVQDVPAIAQVARRHGAFVVMDNTWATPLFFQALEHGVDISVHAATKYIVGHSDALLGVAVANTRASDLLRTGAQDFGQTAGPDDLYLALRGLRTLGVRLRRHQENGLRLAQALLRHPAVRQVLHPGLAHDPGHALWKRDFRGASGLFGVLLQPLSRRQLSVFFSSLELFGIGLSWGGYESLVLPVDPPARSVQPFDAQGVLVRVHAGLEDIDDLTRDFTGALAHATAQQP